MRIAVIGAGGIGGYFGGRLAEAGEDIFFIARGRTLQSLQSGGLRVESPKGNLVIPDVRVTNDPAEVGPVDAVVVAVKAWQVTDVAPSLRPLLDAETAVLPLQNGVEAPGQLAAGVGWEHVLGGLAKIISYVREPGYVIHAGGDPFVALGELDNRKSERVQNLAGAFERAGGAVEIPADIQVAMWEKFLFIASVSGLGALTRASLGDMRSLAATRELLERAMREILAVGRARGVALPDGVVQKSMAFLDTLPPEGTASMQRDIVAGRPSELESQSGAVVRLGKEAGAETPLHSFIYSCLLPMELAARRS